MGEDCESAGSDGTTDEGGGFRQCAGGFSCGAIHLLTVDRPELTLASSVKFLANDRSEGTG
jgi:hypothetical protein